jgi:hypothetical protein
MATRLWRPAVIVSVVMACVGLGTASASLREPRQEVTASFGLSYSAPIVAIPCGFSLRHNKSFLTATGKEIDLSTPAAGLAGHLSLTISWIEGTNSAVLGRMKAVLTDRSTGEVLYSGVGKFVGHEGPLDTMQSRGLLDAVLYSNGNPTARHLVANVAFQIDFGTGHVTGGFGDDLPTGPSIAVETTGKTC